MANHVLAGNAAAAPDAVASGVSWGAILAGAVAAAALSFILVILGFGLGFSSVSAWSGNGMNAPTIGYATVGWITFTQIAASAIGGYLAGRLRVKWASVHTSEVYFRDTAHGLLAWAVASLVTAALLGSAISGALATGVKTAGSAGAAVMVVAGDSDAVSGYFIDTMMRPDMTVVAAPATASDTAAPASPDQRNRPETAVTQGQRTEIARIFANAISSGALPDADKNYLASLLAHRSGVSQAAAGQRVSDTYAAYKQSLEALRVKAQQAADTARKAAAYGASWMFVALLCGAFIASLAATYGGRQRDRSPLQSTDFS